MKESKLFKKFVVTFVVTVLGGPAVVLASTQNPFHESTKVSVSYADLNLEKEEGAKVLYRRLQQASKQVCDVRGFRTTGSLERMVETQRCYREALSASIEKIDNELVTNIHNS